MADLDTTSKRRSSVQVISPWLLAPVLPDGTVGQGDRQHVAWTYAGILAAGALAALVALTLNSRSAGLTVDSRAVTLTVEDR